MMTYKRAAWLGIVMVLLSPLAAQADVLWEDWLGIPGSAVADLTGDPRYPDHPTGSSILPSFEAPTNWADNYGTRMRGYVIPPSTGGYVFWIASDDNSELWLSTDDDPDNKSLIARVSQWTNSREWNKYAEQKSAPIGLTAGRRYYIEALQKEAAGGDNLAVGWAKPGQDTSTPSEVIPVRTLEPWTGYDPSYDHKPVVPALKDREVQEAPVTLRLTAQVEDDGKPLPARPANPDQSDPNKLRWSWSVVSVPSASKGVVWSGNPASGEAFTYDGSPHAPGTVFVCDPYATFDVPGLYVLQFRAWDGQKENVQQMKVSIRSTGLYRQLGYLYLSPIPDAEYVPSVARLILVRFSSVPPSVLTNLSTFVTVTGSVSGRHSGQTHIATDGRTVIFTANAGFQPDEIVTVHLAPEYLARASPIALYEYQFVVAGHIPDPPVITAHGDSPPNQTKDKAFDQDPQTSWADAIVPDGNESSSWIQFVYPGTNETHIVNQYALTSAGDAPQDDPADWRLYGVDESDQLVLLDNQRGQTFSARGQRKVYRIDNAAAFRGYRLEVTRLGDPSLAQAVQLAELEFIPAAGSVLREYWLGIPGTAVSALTSDPNYPNHPSGADQQPRFEAPTDWADNYGTRMRGFITAPKTGSYRFWIASDDGGQLWLSPDDNPAHKSLIANVSGWTNSQEWNKYSEQMSAPINLVSGVKYYIEALQKESGGGDNLAVGWAKPGQGGSAPSEVIPGEVLSPWSSGASPAVSAFAGRSSAVEAAAQTPVASAATDASEEVGGQVLSNGVSIPSDFPTPVITVKGHPAPGYIFLENAGQGGSQYTMMLDNDGNPVWYRRGGGRDFTVQKNGLITWAAFTGVDKNFNWVRNYSAANGLSTDDHELEVLPDGGYLLIGYHDQSGIDVSRYLDGGNPNATVHATSLQEFTAAGDLILQFRAWDHFDIADVEPVVEDPRAANVRFSHMNAIDVDDDGHLVLSSRHISEVTKIDRGTGQIIWRLGGAHSDFTFVNDPLNGFCNQHDISALGNGRYMVFDNGNGHNPPVSRAAEYQLDLKAMTATLVWQFRDTPDKFTYYMGNAQRLPNGHTLINFVLADYPKVTEVDPNGVKQFEMSLQPGSDLYRAFRFPWDGVVATPYLVAEGHEHNVALIFNKFGDHNVVGYRIYGGTAPQPKTLLLQTTSPLARLTDLQNQKQYYFRVTAVDVNGTESGYSNEESLLVNFLKQPGDELIFNGDFSHGQDGWTWTVNGAQGQWDANSGAAHIAITNGGTKIDAIQLSQGGIALSQGGQYELTFDIWGDGTRVVEIEIEQSTSPYTNYSRIGYTYVSPRKQHYSLDFPMGAPTDTNAQIVIGAGMSNAGVYVDNISLKQK